MKISINESIEVQNSCNLRQELDSNAVFKRHVKEQLFLNGSCSALCGFSSVEEKAAELFLKAASEQYAHGWGVRFSREECGSPKEETRTLYRYIPLRDVEEGQNKLVDELEGVKKACIALSPKSVDRAWFKAFSSHVETIKSGKVAITSSKTRVFRSLGPYTPYNILVRERKAT